MAGLGSRLVIRLGGKLLQLMWRGESPSLWAGTPFLARTAAVRSWWMRMQEYLCRDRSLLEKPNVGKRVFFYCIYSRPYE